MVGDELREHYKTAVGAEPVYHQLHTRSGDSLGVFGWPKGTSRLGVHFYASAGASPHGPEACQHSVKLFVGATSGDAAVLEGADMVLSVRKSNSVPSMVCSWPGTGKPTESLLSAKSARSRPRD